MNILESLTETTHHFYHHHRVPPSNHQCQQAPHNESTLVSNVDTTMQLKMLREDKEQYMKRWYGLEKKLETLEHLLHAANYRWRFKFEPFRHAALSALFSMKGIRSHIKMSLTLSTSTMNFLDVLLSKIQAWEFSSLVWETRVILSQVMWVWYWMAHHSDQVPLLGKEFSNNHPQ